MVKTNISDHNLIKTQIKIDISNQILKSKYKYLKKIK